MNITNILSSVLVAMDERDYRKGGSSRNRSASLTAGYERRRNMTRNYSTSDRYPEITSQFMRR